MSSGRQSGSDSWRLLLWLLHKLLLLRLLRVAWPLTWCRRGGRRRNGQRGARGGLRVARRRAVCGCGHRCEVAVAAVHGQNSGVRAGNRGGLCALAFAAHVKGLRVTRVLQRKQQLTKFAA